MNYYDKVIENIQDKPKRWLVTGAAGFIGSHLVENLLAFGQEVTGLDNFSTGFRRNLSLVSESLGTRRAEKFRFIEGDIRNAEVCRMACDGVDYVLHQAALGSVPRSLKDPLTTHSVNVDGFVNMFLAARDAKVERFVYASSSSVYGDSPILPKKEDEIGVPLSPYALSKRMNEEIAQVYGNVYDLKAIGLRYFNVFGPRQDPEGPYAAVIPRWISALTRGIAPVIYGDGETSRDFCYVANVVQANILASIATETERCVPWGEVYNVACGERITLNQLFDILKKEVEEKNEYCAKDIRAEYKDFRQGDIRHSLADISKAKNVLGYLPSHSVVNGLKVFAHSK